MGLTSEDEAPLCRLTLVHGITLACVVGGLTMLLADVLPALVSALPAR